MNRYPFWYRVHITLRIPVVSEHSEIKPHVVEALRTYLLALEVGAAGNLGHEAMEVGDVSVQADAEETEGAEQDEFGDVSLQVRGELERAELERAEPWTIGRCLRMTLAAFCNALAR